MVLAIRKTAAEIANVKIRVVLATSNGSQLRSNNSIREGRVSPLTKLKARVPQEANKITPRRSIKASAM
jgi:hypothetical protein